MEQLIVAWRREVVSGRVGLKGEPALPGQCGWDHVLKLCRHVGYSWGHVKNGVDGGPTGVGSNLTGGCRAIQPLVET